MRKILILLALVGLVVTVLVTAVPVLAVGNGPPNVIVNDTEVPGEVTAGTKSQGPPGYINIWLPGGGNSQKGPVIQIVPRSIPAN